MRRAVMWGVVGVTLVLLFGAWRLAEVREGEFTSLARGMHGTATAITGFIEGWMQERRADMALLAAAGDPQSLRTVVATHDYEAGWIVQRAGRRVVHSAATAPPTPEEWTEIERIAAGGTPPLAGLFDPRDGMVRVLFVSEIWNAPGTAVAVRADLTPALLPYLQSLSRVSTTGRSLVASRAARSAGDDAVIVLDAGNSGARQVHRLAAAAVPAHLQAALEGNEATLFARDVYGEPVYAATRHVQGVGWGVARQLYMDEILARVHRRVLTETGLAAAILLVLGWGVLAHRRALRIQTLDADLARTQLETLRAQLQPHFLFNVLGSIGELVHSDPPGAEAMLQRLARLLRFSLATGKDVTVPLAQEIDVVRAYVDIERVRWSDRIAFEYDVDPRLATAMVPPFLLQPLVENAVRHAFADVTAGGRVMVRAQGDDGRLRLSVEDNGAGGAATRRSAASGLGIGLDATRGRLERLYGDAHRLTVESAPGEGTRITIDLPLVHAAARAASDSST